MQHHVVLRVDRQDDAGILATLRLVNRACVGKDQLVDLGRLVVDRPSAKVDSQAFFSLAPRQHPSHITVEDVELVVVADLHDAVALTQAPCRGGVLARGRIQEPLKLEIQVLGADQAASHRCQDLDIAMRVETETARNPTGHEVQDRLENRFRLLPFDEEEVLGSALELEVGKLAAPDAVGVGNNPALSCLAKDRLEPYHVGSAGIDQVGQHSSRAD